jgi:hypothetical protein
MLKRCLLFRTQKDKTHRSHAMNTTVKEPRKERNVPKCSLLIAGDTKLYTAFLLAEKTQA